MNEFRPEGPYSAEKLIAAAAEIAELWRYLGHATINGTRALLDDPADAHTLVAELATADRRAADVLDRLAMWARNLGDESTYTDRFASVEPDGSRDQVQSVMHQASDQLLNSAANHSGTAGALDRAAGWIDHVYRTDIDA